MEQRTYDPDLWTRKPSWPEWAAVEIVIAAIAEKRPIPWAGDAALSLEELQEVHKQRLASILGSAIHGAQIAVSPTYAQWQDLHRVSGFRTMEAFAIRRQLRHHVYMVDRVQFLELAQKAGYHIPAAYQAPAQEPTPTVATSQGGASKKLFWLPDNLEWEQVHLRNVNESQIEVRVEGRAPRLCGVTELCCSYEKPDPNNAQWRQLQTITHYGFAFVEKTGAARKAFQRLKKDLCTCFGINSAPMHKIPSGQWLVNFGREPGCLLRHLETASGHENTKNGKRK